MGGASDNAQRSGAGWVSARDKLHGRVVERRWVVEMARTVIVIRRCTDECGAQPRVASARVRVHRELRRARAQDPCWAARTFIFVADSAADGASGPWTSMGGASGNAQHSGADGHRDTAADGRVRGPTPRR